MADLILAFWRHAERHYRRPDGTPTNELDRLRVAFRPLRRLYETLPAAEFSPQKLKAVRQVMIDAGLNRRVINQRVGRITHMFKWGVAEELVPVATLQALKALPGLQKGRCAAPEPEPVRPVADADVDAVLPHVLPEVAAMIELQRATGMRPGEVCGLRPCELDRTGEVWLYRPDDHKTAHRGKARVIPLGPKAQAVLAPWLAQPGLALQDFVFSPRRAVAAMRVRRRAARKSKVTPSQVSRKRKKPLRLPGERYPVRSYCHAVAKGVERAYAARAAHDVQDGQHGPNWAPVAPWHPHQLRHTYATEIRRRFGLEAAQVVLGHSQANVTEIYAERNLGLAVKVAAEAG